jgi:hypothetical protein
MELFEILDKRFAPYAIPIVLLEKLYTGLRWPKALSISLTTTVFVQRCAQQSDLAFRRAINASDRLSRRLEFFERQHAGPARPTCDLRASHASCDSNRIRRNHHRPRR